MRSRGKSKRGIRWDYEGRKYGGGIRRVYEKRIGRANKRETRGKLLNNSDTTNPKLSDRFYRTLIRGNTKCIS